MDRRRYPHTEKESLASEDPVLQTLIPQHIVDPASQRLFAISIFAAIQCWKIYDILLVKADAFAASNLAVSASTTTASAGVPIPTFTSLNNFTFVLKYAFIDGLFLWVLPVLNIPLLAFLPLFTLLLTAAINLANFVLTSNSALPLLSSTFVPLWNLVHKDKELTILGDKVTPEASIDMNAHFRGRYTIQYLPESSVMLNPFHFGNMCLEAPDLGSYTFPSAINLPIEFNTTNDVGFILIQRTTPENTVDFLNYTRADIRRLAKRDYSGYAKWPEYISTDERVFYLDAEIKKPGKYKIHRVLDVDGMVIRPYKSEFTIGHCPAAKFVYPGLESAYKGYKCFSKDVSDLSWTVPMVSAFGMLPLTVHLATYQNGKKINTFEHTIAETTTEPNVGLSWLHSQLITRNSVEQELLRSPQNFNTISLGKLEFQILSVSDSHGNQRLYNDQSKDKDINFPVEIRKAPLLVLRDRHPSKKLVLNSLKTLHIETIGSPSFPVKVNLVHEDEQTPRNAQTLEFTFNSMEELANGLQISLPGRYFLLSGSDKFCPCEAESTAIHIERPPLPSVQIKDKPIFDKCVGTIGYEFDLQFIGTPPFEVLYEVYKNSSGIIKPVLSDRALKQHKTRSLKHDYSFNFKPNKEGSYILVFKSIKDLYYNQSPVPVTEAENTFSTHIKKRSQYMFSKDSRTKVKTINLCKDQLTEVPVYFEGHFPFSFTHEIVDLKTGNVLKTEKHDKQFQNNVVLQIPKFIDGGEYGVVVKDVTDSLGCSAELFALQEVRIRARKETPLMAIAESATSYIVQGDSVKVPLRVASNSGMSSDDRIVYLWTSLYDRSNVKNFTLQGRSGLVVRDEGIYQLESFSNGGCLGVVQNRKNTFTLHHYAKPNLTVVPENEHVLSKPDAHSFALTPLCQGDSRKVRIQLQGKQPFLVNYEIKFPSGKVKLALLEIDNKEILLPLPSLREGQYEIVFTGVSDTLYTKEKLIRLNHKHESSLFTYEVKAHPVLKVENPFIQLCETKVKDDLDLKIPVKLDGVAPFTIQGKIISNKDANAKSFVIENLREPVISLQDLNLQNSYTELFSVGEHDIHFESISDASHCNSLKLDEENKVRIHITKVPSIKKQSQKDYYCVGDRISYNMSGISPFVVYYKFNEENRRADLKHDFTRLATKPGELAIVALQDASAGQCLVNYTKRGDEYERLKLRVHDLPSVEISHGDSIIKNLHEGDQSEIIFKFIGTPPFLVTYVRTLGDEGDQHKRRKGNKLNRGNRRVVDTKTVRDIWDYEHSEVVSLQGTYDAIEITDAFCRATRDVQEIL